MLVKYDWIPMNERLSCYHCPNYQDCWGGCSMFRAFIEARHIINSNIGRTRKRK